MRPEPNTNHTTVSLKDMALTRTRRFAIWKLLRHSGRTNPCTCALYYDYLRGVINLSPPHGNKIAQNKMTNQLLAAKQDGMCLDLEGGKYKCNSNMKANFLWRRSQAWIKEASALVKMEKDWEDWALWGQTRNQKWRRASTVSFGLGASDGQRKIKNKRYDTVIISMAIKIMLNSKYWVVK